MLWKSESASIVEAVTPKSARASAVASACSANAGLEKLRKKKRVDSCGMLVQTTEIIIASALRASGSDPECSYAPCSGGSVKVESRLWD